MGIRGKRHKKTPELSALARSGALYGVPHHMIATLMKISTDTLLDRYDEELADGKARCSFTVTQTLHRLAIGDKEAGVPPNLGALCFIAKCQLNWRETNVNQHQMIDANGKPMTPGMSGMRTVSAEEIKLISQELEEAV